MQMYDLLNVSFDSYDGEAFLTTKWMLSFKLEQESIKEDQVLYC